MNGNKVILISVDGMRPEDTTIPMFYIGKQFEAGKRFSGGSILDIAPTIAKIMDIAPADEWEGVSVI